MRRSLQPDGTFMAGSFTRTETPFCLLEKVQETRTDWRQSEDLLRTGFLLTAFGRTDHPLRLWVFLHRNDYLSHTSPKDNILNDKIVPQPWLRLFRKM